jgi:hypothetical protein
MKSAGFRRRAVLLFLLAFVLAFPWAGAAGPRLESDQAVAPSASAFLEDLLGRAWSVLMGIRNKEGCHLDPDGRCAPRPTIQRDTGCHLDPNGGCRS